MYIYICFVVVGIQETSICPDIYQEWQVYIYLEYQTENRDWKKGGQEEQRLDSMSGMINFMQD